MNLDRKSHSEVNRNAVLIIDDDEDFLDLVTEQLRGLGFRVFPASNSKTAQEIFKENKDINLLLTDMILLNDRSGRAIAEEFKKLRKNIKVLFMSGYPVHANIHTGLSDGQSSFLRKPFSINDLHAKIKSLLDA